MIACHVGDNMNEQLEDTSKSYDIEHEFYDIMFSDLDHDFEFYLDMAKEYGTPILECMCGTGRMLLHLAGKGFEIEGLDLNENMLSRAEKKIANEPEEIRTRIKIWKDDLRTFSSDRKYNLIFIPFSSFLHILTHEDRFQALAQMKKYLAETGVIIIDIFNPDLTRPENVLKFDRKTKTVPETGETFCRFYTQSFNREKHTIDVQYIYDLVDSGGLVRRKFNNLEIAYLFYDDVKQLADKTGLKIVKVYGDHSKNEFSEKSPTMIWVLKK